MLKSQILTRKTDEMSKLTISSVLSIIQRIILPAILILVFSVGWAKAPEVVFPSQTWVIQSPSEAGLDADSLKRLSSFVGGNGCVIRGGYLVHTWGNYRQRTDVASAAKPIYAHFLFKAIETGRIKDIDGPVAEYEPRLKTINALSAFKDKEITWRHLTNQTACYGVSEKPGTAFVYNDWQMALFVDTLFLKVYKRDYASMDKDVLHPLLTDLLGCEDNPTFMAFGTDERPGRLAISPRDFARFGLLYLRRGNWNGRQLLSPGFARMAVSDPLPNSIPRTSGKEAGMIPGQRTLGSRVVPDNQGDHNGSYSWLWWTNGVDRNGSRNWPDASLDTYGALGHGGNEAMIVIPSLDMIISWNGSSIDSSEKQNQAIRLLVDSMQNPNLMQNQIIVDKDNSSWLARRDGSPFFMCGPGDPEGFLYRGKLNPDGTRNGDQMELIKKLAGTGANCIYMIAVRSHGGDGDKTQNPFIGNDLDKELNSDLLNQWEAWFTEMDRNNIVIYLIFYDDSTKLWNTGNAAEKKESNFFIDIVGRFKHHKNLIWCIAEEYQEALSAERVWKMAAIIRKNDEYAHPIAVHKLSGLDFTEFADDPNIDQFAVQFNVKTAKELHNGLIKARKSAAGRYNLNMSESVDFGTGDEARKKLWSCAMAGSYAMVLGMDIAGTSLSDLDDCGKLVRFMESTAFNEMSPHDELAYGGTDYVLASSDDSFILYSASVEKTMGLKRIKPGNYELNWFNCINGQWVIQPHVKVLNTTSKWNKPSIVVNEAALYIRREK
ncbi:MAG: apiosidase-like domain-containing protein [Armatimonadota bacterium]